MALNIPITNTGNLDGEEIVQVYLRKPDDSNAPLRTLRTFKRVKIAAGQTKNVTILLTDESFEWFDTESNTICTVAGAYELLYGSSSRIENLQIVPVNINPSLFIQK